MRASNYAIEWLSYIGKQKGATLPFQTLDSLALSTLGYRTQIKYKKSTSSIFDLQHKIVLYGHMELNTDVSFVDKPRYILGTYSWTEEYNEFIRALTSLFNIGVYLR